MMDPERFRHKSVHLYWVWNEKTEFLKRTVDTNPFHSDFFAWVDIGYFRTKRYNGKTMLVKIPATLQQSTILMLDLRILSSEDYLHYVGGGRAGGTAVGL